MQIKIKKEKKKKKKKRDHLQLIFPYNEQCDFFAVTPDGMRLLQ